MALYRAASSAVSSRCATIQHWETCQIPLRGLIGLLTLETHCPSRLINDGVHAPVAITTRSASYCVPSFAITPMHRVVTGSIRGRSNVPDLFASRMNNEQGALSGTYSPNTICTPNLLSSRPTESTASFAAPHPALAFQIPCHPLTWALARCGQ
jgi:hypothetical protein